MVRRYDCPFCPSTFARSDTRSRHINRMHGAVPPVYPCIICGFNFNTVQELHLHIEGHAPQVDYERVEAADGGGHIYRKYYVPATASLELTLGRDHATLCDILAHEAVTKRYAKCSITVMAEFVKVTPDGLVDRSVTIYLKSKTFALTLYQDYEYFIRRCHAEIVVNAEDMVQNGSDWILHAVHRTEMLVAKCNPLQGACGQLPVSMPRDILNFRQVTADDDRACFFRCIARHFVDSDDEAVLNGWIRANLDTGSFQLPFRVDKIADFEGRHSATLNFKINVIYKVTSKLDVHSPRKAIDISFSPRLRRVRISTQSSPPATPSPRSTSTSCSTTRPSPGPTATWRRSRRTTPTSPTSASCSGAPTARRRRGGRATAGVTSAPIA